MELIKLELSFKDQCGFWISKRNRDSKWVKGHRSKVKRWERTRAHWKSSCRPVCFELGGLRGEQSTS